MSFTVRHAARHDAAAWLRMRRDLWPDGAEAEHRAEIEQFLGGTAAEPAAVLIAFDGEGPVGMAELSIRASAEGCRTNRVAYLEGWYVTPGRRREGVGRALLEAAERWGREQGCAEFASDAVADNTGSIQAHRALGFEDAGLIRCFRKDL